MKKFTGKFIILFTLVVMPLLSSCKDDVIIKPIIIINKPIVNQNYNPLADSSIDAYNKVFLVTSNGLKYYKTSLTNNDKDYFWCQALDIQMMEDVYLRTKSPTHQKIIYDLLNTFLVQNASNGDLYNWGWNDYNDDLLWAGLAFVRGYQITGNTVFLTQAKYAFDLLYNRGWDTTLGGGIWWDVAHTSKSGLSNNPAVILACYMYECTQDKSYLTKATSIYAWIRKTLFNTTTGAVYENISPEGKVSTSANVYNIGAFIGAANHLHRLTGQDSYFDDAKLSVDYVKTNNNILSSGQRDGTWQSEFARALGEFVRDNNLWSLYYTWMRQNADAAWNARRIDKNIIWNKWAIITPTDNITRAVECASAVVMLQVTPTVQPGFPSNVSYRFISKTDSVTALNVLGSGTENGTLVDVENWTDGSNQKFKVVLIGRGYYRLVPNHVTNKSLAVTGGLSENGTTVEIDDNNSTTSQYWKLIYDYDGFYKLKPKCAPSSCMRILEKKCIISLENNNDSERWLMK